MLKTTALSVIAILIFSSAPLRTQATPEQIVVAAASDLSFAFQDVAAEFEKVTGNSVKLAFGSSGNFFSQIQNGAPFDLFFSADINYPRKLEAAGLIEPRSLYARTPSVRLCSGCPRTPESMCSGDQSRVGGPATGRRLAGGLCHPRRRAAPGGVLPHTLRPVQNSKKDAGGQPTRKPHQAVGIRPIGNRAAL